MILLGDPGVGRSRSDIGAGPGGLRDLAAGVGEGITKNTTSASVFNFLGQGDDLVSAFLPLTVVPALTADRHCEQRGRWAHRYLRMTSRPLNRSCRH